MSGYLTDEERAAADAAVARLRAERDVLDAGGDLGGFRIERDDEGPQGAGYDEPGIDPLDELVADQEARDVEDFTAFWSARGRRGKTLRNVVPGVDVQLPASLPLAFEIEARRLQRDSSLAAVHRVFGLLYGRDTLARLIDGGLDGEQLSVLIVWGSANAAGQDMTLAEAVDEHARMVARKRAEGNGKRPPGSGTTSSGTGRSSRPTTPASTRSKKKRSKR